MYTLPSYFVILCEGGNSEDPCIETSSGREKRSPQAGGAALAALGLGGNLSLGLDGMSLSGLGIGKEKFNPCCSPGQCFVSKLRKYNIYILIVGLFRCLADVLI